jgi:hypothetical protein
LFSATVNNGIDGWEGDKGGWSMLNRGESKCAICDEKLNNVSMEKFDG